MRIVMLAVGLASFSRLTRGGSAQAEKWKKWKKWNKWKSGM